MKRRRSPTPSHPGLKISMPRVSGLHEISGSDYSFTSRGSKDEMPAVQISAVMAAAINRDVLSVMFTLLGVPLSGKQFERLAFDNERKEGREGKWAVCMQDAVFLCLTCKFLNKSVLAACRESMKACCNAYYRLKKTRIALLHNATEKYTLGVLDDVINRLDRCGNVPVCLAPEVGEAAAAALRKTGKCTSLFPGRAYFATVKRTEDTELESSIGLNAQFLSVEISSLEKSKLVIPSEFEFASLRIELGFGQLSVYLILESMSEEIPFTFLNISTIEDAEAWGLRNFPIPATSWFSGVLDAGRV